MITASSPRPLRKSVLISDLHLSDTDPEGIHWFEGFLGQLRPENCEELFILGDLFDYWVGPKQMKLTGYQPVIQALRKLSSRGIALTVLRGNRDGYLEEHFANATGARVGEDVIILENNGQRILLTHGDLLCTRDVKYQRFRKFLRSRPIAWLGPRLPLSWGLFLARGLRRYSQRVVPMKLTEEKGIVDETIKHFLKTWNGQTLICGHVHYREDRSIKLEGKEARLIILPAFGKGEPTLRFEKNFDFALPARTSA